MVICRCLLSKKSNGAYNVSPVGIATYAQISPRGIGFSSIDNIFAYEYSQPANGTNLAKRDSEAKVFYNGTLSHTCPRKYLFTKTKTKAGKNYSELTMIPEIGIIQEKTGFNQTDAENNVLNLVSVNGNPIESYLSQFCTGKDLNFSYKGTFYSNRSGSVDARRNGGTTITNLEGGGMDTEPNNNTTTTEVTTTVNSPSGCPVYKDLDVNLYIDRTTGKPATLECGGNTYRNGYMVTQAGSAITNTNPSTVIDDNANNVAENSSGIINISPGPGTHGLYCPEVSSDGIHIVQPNETLFSIARIYGIGVDDLRSFNRLTGDRIYPCMKLNTRLKVAANIDEELVARDVPQNIVHVVKPGETIYQLANKYGFTVDKFKQINGLESNIISVGQKLKISDCNCPTPQEPAALASTDIPDSFDATGGRLIVDAAKKREIHIVKENETIYSIAKIYNISVANLRKINNLEVNEVIIPYQRLYLN